MKLSPNTEIWFFNKELGYVGYNLVKHLVASENINVAAWERLETTGYYEITNDNFIEMYVVIKAVKVDDRDKFIETRDNTAYDKIKTYLMEK